MRDAGSASSRSSSRPTQTGGRPSASSGRHRLRAGSPRTPPRDGSREFDILRPWLARRAGGSAEDARRLHAGEEHAVVARVPAQECAVHFTVEGRFCMAATLHGRSPRSTENATSNCPIGAGGRIRRISVAWRHRGGAHDRRDPVRLARPRGRAECPAAPETTVTGMKLFERVEDMEATRGSGGRRRSTRPTRSSAWPRARLDRGITADDLAGAQCRAVVGLGTQDEAWKSGQEFVGVWHATAEDARLRQESPERRAVRSLSRPGRQPLESGRLDPPTSAWSTRHPAR